jgi:hypothetical protein
VGSVEWVPTFGGNMFGWVPTWLFIAVVLVLGVVIVVLAAAVKDMIKNDDRRQPPLM